jgi:hypothetical protein
VSDGFRRVPFTAEVRSFKAVVGGYEQFLAGLRPQDRTIISNAMRDGIGRRLGNFSQPRDDRLFRKWHEE